MSKLICTFLSLFLITITHASNTCEPTTYNKSNYKDAIDFFTSLKPAEGLGNCPDLILPEVEERVECNVWNPSKFRGYSYFFILPYHEKYGPQGHYLMIGEKNTQTVWTIGSQNKGNWFTTRISTKIDIKVEDNQMSWEFKQGLHRIVSTLEKDDGDNLIRFQAKAYKRGLFSSNEKVVYDTICQ